MFVPFSVSDFIDRAVQVYGDRVGAVDEPQQPATPLGNDAGELTYAEMGGWPVDRRHGWTSSGSASGTGWRWSATTARGC